VAKGSSNEFNRGIGKRPSPWDMKDHSHKTITINAHCLDGVAKQFGVMSVEVKEKWIRY
jgi:hypothetical protein